MKMGNFTKPFFHAGAYNATWGGRSKVHLKSASIQSNDARGRTRMILSNGKKESHRREIRASFTRGSTGGKGAKGSPSRCN